MSARAVRRFRARRGDRNLYAVTVDDDELFFCGWHRARRLVAFFNRWQPSDAEIANFVLWSSDEASQYARECRRIPLRFDAICERCGQTIPAGSRASWHPTSTIVLHGARCPLRVDETRGES